MEQLAVAAYPEAVQSSFCPYNLIYRYLIQSCVHRGLAVQLLPRGFPAKMWHVFVVIPMREPCLSHCIKYNFSIVMEESVGYKHVAVKEFYICESVYLV
jgi:hypothetical protein